MGEQAQRMVCDWGEKRLDAGPTNEREEGRILNVYDLSLSRLSGRCVPGACMGTHLEMEEAAKVRSIDSAEAGWLA